MSVLNGETKESFIQQQSDSQLDLSNAQKLANMVLKINLSNTTEDGSIGVGHGYLVMMREVAKEIKGGCK